MTAERPAAVAADPQTVVEALEVAGFTPYTVRTGVYVGMRWPKNTGAQTSIIVPLDQSAPEYASMVESLTSALECIAAAGDAARRALKGIARP